MPLGGLLAAGLAPVVGGLVKGGLGIGKNKTRAPSFAETKEYDPDAAFYGGRREGLQNYSANLNTRRLDSEGREANLANYGQASNWDSQAAQSRTSQGNAANLMMQRATGAAPSIAGQQAELDARRAYSQQMATAASARGAAGVALAGQTAANNISNQGAAMSNQAQINAANERLQAEQAAFGAYGNIRQGDVYQSQTAADRAQFQAMQQQRNREANDNRAMQYEQLEGRANEAALNARVQNQGTLAGGASNAATLNAQRVENNTRRANEDWVQMGSGLKGGGGAGAPVPARASGGPVAAGQPYKVGEVGREALVSGGRARLIGQRGPEIIVPREDGYVIPNHALSANASLVRQVNALNKGGRGQSRGKPARSSTSGPSFDELSAKRPNRIAPATVRERAALQEYLAEQRAAKEEQDIRDEEARIYAEQDRRIAAMRAEDSRRARDPAVGLERIERDRALLNRGGPRPEMTATEDERRGVAPGTTDFERSSPKNTDAESFARYGRIAGSFFGGARAAGGPVSAGVPYLVGEGGFEALVPGGAGAGPGPASFDVIGAGGGMDVMGSDAAHKAFGTRFASHAGASPMGYREEGGPVEAGKPYVVGEAGEEAFVPRSYDTALTPEEEKAYQNWKVRYAPNDSGADYDLRGAFKSGLTPDPQNGHWPDTFKKPNHETFSDESIYATGENADKAGHWEGERFFPPQPRQPAPHPHPLPAPKPPPIRATSSADQFESPSEQAVYDYARTMQGQGLGRNSYDVAAMMRNAPEGPSYAEKMKEAKEGPKTAHQLPPIDWKGIMSTANLAALVKGGKKEPEPKPEPKTEKKSTGVNRPAPKRKR